MVKKTDVPLLLIASLAGAAATEWAYRIVNGQSLIGLNNFVAAGVLDSDTTDDPMISGFVNSQLIAFRAAGELSDPLTLEREIGRLAGAGRSTERDIELEAQFLRFLSLDPKKAIRLAVELSLDHDLIALMFEVWTSSDSSSALAELAELTHGSLRRMIGIELASKFAHTQEDLQKFAAVAGEGNRNGFISDALVRSAENDPIEAIQTAMSFGDYTLRESTVRRIAREWAWHDVSAALAYLPEIRQPSLRHLFHLDLITEWASVNAEQVLGYLASEEGQRLLSVLPQQHVARLASKLVIHRPEETLVAANSIPGIPGQQLRSIAWQRLIDIDLPSAIAQLQSLPIGPERQQLAQRIAASYARQSPEDALEWARDFDRAVPTGPSVAGAESSVIAEIARDDIASAIQIALASNSGAATISYLLSNNGNLTSLTPSGYRDIADKLLAAGQPQTTALVALMRSWPQRHPESAWNWLVHMPSQSDGALYRTAAAGFASRSMERSVQEVYQLPPERRGDWIVAFAGNYAKREPNAAIDWLVDFSSEPLYDEWVAEVVRMLVVPGASGDPRSPHHPRPAAAIVDTLQTPSQEMSAAVAASWAQQEPREATRWAVSVRDPDARTTAVAAAVGAWTVDDPVAARQWVLGLPEGSSRDRALGAQLSQGIASHGSIDPLILNAFSPDNAIENAMRHNSFALAFRWLGSRDAERAEALITTYVGDADLRQELLDHVAIGRQGGRSVHRDAILSVRP